MMPVNILSLRQPLVDSTRTNTQIDRTQAAEEAEEAVKRAERERDVLRAEKHVWTVAHSGVQAELANLSAALERERQAHEDTRAALKRAKEVAHKAKGDAEAAKARLDVKGDERALQAALEELANARAEIRDLTEAVGACIRVCVRASGFEGPVCVVCVGCRVELTHCCWH